MDVAADWKVRAPGEGGASPGLWQTNWRMCVASAGTESDRGRAGNGRIPGIKTGDTGFGSEPDTAVSIDGEATNAIGRQTGVTSVEQSPLSPLMADQTVGSARPDRVVPAGRHAGKDRVWQG